MRGSNVESLVSELKRLTGTRESSEQEAAARSPGAQYRLALQGAKEIQDKARQLLAELGPEKYLDDTQILGLLDRSPLSYQLDDGTPVDTCGMMDRLTHVPEYLFAMGDVVREALGGLRARQVRKIKVYGLGGSATPAAIAREIIGNSGGLGFEFEVVRRDSPSFGTVDGETLLVFSSYSGNTEEVLHAFCLARRDSSATTSPMLAMSAGGRLQELACEYGVPWVRVPRRVLQPRESLVLQTIALLHIVSELEMPAGDQRSGPFRLDEGVLRGTADSLRCLLEEVKCETPLRQNRAKQIAVQLLCGDARCWEALDRKLPDWYPLIPVVMSSEPNAAVAYEFYTQLCEASKVLCHVATYPEAFHNLVECMRFSLLSQEGARWSLYFLESPDDESRVAQRWCHTLSEVFPGLAHCSHSVTGETALERSIAAYLFNAWVRLYVAFLNGVEPLPVPVMSHMKSHMAGVERSCSH
jgi:hypothetical protein